MPLLVEIGLTDLQKTVKVVWCEVVHELLFLSSHYFVHLIFVLAYIFHGKFDLFI